MECKYFQHTSFISFAYTPSNGISGSYGSSTFQFLRNLRIIFHYGFTNLHSHQQHARVPFTPHHHQHLLSFVFLTIAILTEVRWPLTVILICIFLVISDIKHFPMTYWTFICLILKNVHSSSLPILKSGFLFALELFEFLIYFMY
jgi:hypothetical protein